jgi:hypothetical protein
MAIYDRFQTGKKTPVNFSGGELVDMAKALSAGEFDRKLQQYFHGELDQLPAYLEPMRQTL